MHARTYARAAVFILVFAGVALAVTSTATAAVSPLGQVSPRSPSLKGATTGALTPHAPIFIDGSDASNGFVVRDPTTDAVDWDATRAKTGVVSGDGTAEDPYVIEGWTILAEPAVLTHPKEARFVTTNPFYAIDIRNTEAHFVVQSTEVLGAGADSGQTGGVGGFYVMSVTNGSMNNVSARALSLEGVFIRHSPAFALSDCTSSGNGVRAAPSAPSHYGILVYWSPEAKVERCTTDHNTAGGISVANSPRTEVTESSSHNNSDAGLYYGFGLKVYDSPQTVVRDCVIRDNNVEGLVVEGSPGTLITGCNVSSSSDAPGIRLKGNATLERSVVHDNAIGVILSGDANVVRRCEIKDNQAEGIRLVGNAAKGNVIEENALRQNAVGLGVVEDESGKPAANRISNNYFWNAIEFERNFAAADDANAYNVAKSAGTNIVGGPFLGGNFWGDYPGSDTDGDGLGDTDVPWGPGDAHPLLPTGGGTGLPPFLPADPSPASGAAAVGSRPLLRWSSSDPEGDPITYDVYFGTDPNPPSVAESSLADSFDPGVLARSTTYYWRVVVREWGTPRTIGATWSFATAAPGEQSPPGEPMQSAPADDALLVSPNPRLAVWVSDLDADLTRVRFYGRAQDEAAFDLIGERDGVTSGSEAALYWPGRAYLTTYEWYATATDGEADASSTVRSFTTRAPSPATISSAQIPHLPIDIKGDSEFTAQNGVTDGTGTSDDPYIIEGWNIDGTGAGAGIYGITIEATSAHYVVRNVYVHDQAWGGIMLHGAPNGRLENFVAEWSTTAYTDGVVLWSSADVVVADCTISHFNGPGRAVEVWGSPRAVVRDCEFDDNTLGIGVWGSADVVVERNTVRSSPGMGGIEVGAMDGGRMSGNTLEGGTFGISPADEAYPRAAEFDIDIDTSNTRNGKPIYYLRHEDGLVIDETWQDRIGWLGLVSSTNVTIRGITLDSSLLLTNVTGSTVEDCAVHDTGSVGIMLLVSRDNTISNCRLSNTTWALGLLSSSDNVLSGIVGEDNIYGGFGLVNSDDNTILDCSIHRTTALSSHGIALIASSRNTFDGCDLTDETTGMRLKDGSNDNVLTRLKIRGGDNLEGASLTIVGSSGNAVRDCDMREGRIGVWIDQRSNGTAVTGCTLADDTYGIQIRWSPDNILRNNTMLGSGFGVNPSGALRYPRDFNQDIDASNTIDGVPIQYFVGARDLDFDAAATPTAYLALVDSRNVTIRNLEIDALNAQGVVLANTTESSIVDCRIRTRIAQPTMFDSPVAIAIYAGSADNVIEDCVAYGSDFGLLIDSSSNNRVTGLSVHDNAAGGVYIASSTDNLIESCEAFGNGFGVGISGSQGNVVRDCAVHDNGDGFYAAYSNGNTFQDCISASNAYTGAYFADDAIGNLVTGCDILGNPDGVQVTQLAPGNRITGNNFRGASNAQGSDESSGSDWDGNHWSDYAGVDANGDGRGDTPYGIRTTQTDTAPQDHAPSMSPFAGAGPNLRASFAYASNGAHAYQFTDWSMAPGGSIASWSWSFGDGGTSQARNPLHGYATASTYAVSLTITDDQGRTATRVATLIVREGNAPPVIAHHGHKAVAETSTLAFPIAVSDADGDRVSVTAAGLPVGASYVDGTRVFSWTPTFDQAGTYVVTFTASDGALNDSIDVAITVVNTNRAPALAAIPDQSAREGDAIGFTLAATDPDGDAVTYSGEELPAGASIDSVTGAFSWTPTYTQAGIHSLRLVASDGTLADTRRAKITVADVQRPPVLAHIGSQVAFEGAAMTIEAGATDPEGDVLTLIVSPVPAGASFADRHDGTGVFSWTPGAHARGDYSVTFRATDGVAEVSETVTIRVAPANGVPSFTPIGSRTVSENDALNFVVSAIDSNGDALAYSASNVPRGAGFDAARRVFSWQPDFAQAGSYTVAFHVSDGTTSATENATISVTNVNRAPIVSGPTSVTIKANRTLSMSIPIVDPDGVALTNVVTGLPDGATVTDGVITWRPTTAQVGDHSFGVEATDGALSVHATLTMSVTENLAPLVGTKAPVTAEVLKPTAFVANASDPDGAALPTIAWDFDAADGFQAQRTGANVTWAFPATGDFAVTVRATDADGMLTTQTFNVSVDDNVALVIEALPDLGDGSGTPARATVTNWDGTGIANATVTLNVYYEPITGAGKILLRTITVTTSEDGSVIFEIPQDTPFMDLKGTHVLEASAITQTSLGGGQETAEDTDEYTL